MNSPKVLLATPYGPFDSLWGENPHDLFASRLTRGNGAFSMSAHFHEFGLHMIGENLSCPVTVLEEPTKSDFERELDGDYDVVGLHLKSLHARRVLEMCRLVRAKLPEARIVLGGYGVGALDDPVPADRGLAEELQSLADALCREEGVAFMRRYLNDPSEGEPVTQYLLPWAGFTVRGFLRRYMHVPSLLAGLGCPTGCSFCNTSAFFGKSKTRVAEPEALAGFLKRHRERMNADLFLSMIFDEDIFLDAEYARRFGRALREDRSLWGAKWFGFGSVRSLSKLDPEEVREMGCGAVWIGVESFDAPPGSREGADLPKRTGDAEAVIRGLHDAGVLTVLSLPFGYDFQTEDDILGEIDRFVALKPPFHQIAPIQPCPGTELFRRLREQGRLDPDLDWNDFHLWKADAAGHPHLKPGRAKELFELAHRRLAEENGPPFLSMLEIFLNARERLAGRTDAYGRRQYEHYGTLASLNRNLLPAVRRHAANAAIRERVDALCERYAGLVRSPGLVDRVVQGVGIWSMARAVARGTGAGESYQPPLRRTRYDGDGDGRRAEVRKGSLEAVPVDAARRRRGVIG
jgi:radical SAM superfamily enzyme YgiQ (UPF0313 family)